jgi:dTDP-4-dehydrorhamnose reductase
MKILVLGADGMLGHQLVSSLSGRHEVAGTVRKPASSYVKISDFLPDTLFDSVDIRDFSLIEEAINLFSPHAVINAIGIVKQRQESKDAIESIEVNSLLPHRLADLCSKRESRLVHLSTDCVFSGKKGSYTDDAPHDAQDLYGRSKSMGEVEGPGVITLRTSIIGLELARKASLIEWFLAQKGQINGFTKAIYTGFTTIEMARIIEMVLMRKEAASGIYNVSSNSIDKYSLLSSLNNRLDRPVTIQPDDTFVCDRSLDSSRFQAEFGYQPPSWDQMLDELAGQFFCAQRD